MGITIHYQGKLKSPELISEVCRELKKIAQSMDWEYTILDEDFNKPNTAKLEVRENGCHITGHLPLKGIQLNLHKGCPSFTLYFDANGILREVIQMVQQETGKEDMPAYVSVKTQYAPPDIHIAIIKLLKHLQNKYFSELTVVDEGEYWETGNKSLLIEKMEFLADKIESFAQALSEIKEDFKDCDSDIAIAAKLEEILKNKFCKYFETTKTKTVH